MNEGDIVVYTNRGPTKEGSSYYADLAEVTTVLSSGLLKVRFLDEPNRDYAVHISWIRRLSPLEALAFADKEQQ